MFLNVAIHTHFLDGVPHLNKVALSVTLFVSGAHFLKLISQNLYTGNSILVLFGCLSFGLVPDVATIFELHTNHSYMLMDLEDYGHKTF